MNSPFNFDISSRPTIDEIHELYRTNKAKPSEVAEYFLEQIKLKNPEINAFFKATEKTARETAARLDSELLEIMKPNELLPANTPISDLPIRFASLFGRFPLFGIPFSTKAIIQLEGEIFNASSKIMDNYKAVFSATVMEKMLESGAILVGITNMDQWAMGSSGESSDFGNIKNPFDLERTPGGSSAGAVASVAGGMAVFALGTDTGGSIRQPAAFCDVVGLKPTYGLVSRSGVMPMASSLDQVGAITNNVLDNILVNKILAGKDQKDQTTIESGELVSKLSSLILENQNKIAQEKPQNFNQNLSGNLNNQLGKNSEKQNKNGKNGNNDKVENGIKSGIKKEIEDKSDSLDAILPMINVQSNLGTAQNLEILKIQMDNQNTKLDQKTFRIGIPKEFYIDGLDPIISQSLENLQKELIAKGHSLVSVDLPLTKYAVAVYYMTMGVEVAANLERIDGIRYGKQEDYQKLYFEHRGQFFGKEAKRRIMLGTYASSSGYYDAYYNQAQKVRELARRDFDKAFEVCDLILTPTTPEFPFKLGEKTEDPLKMYLSDVFTCGINPVRIPGLAVPLGLFDVPNCDHKLPTGCQILAPELGEDLIYTLALEIEEIIGNKEKSQN